MLSRFHTAAIILLASASSAVAACPTIATGTSAEIIAANSARVLCLQQELSAETDRRKFEFDLNTMQRSIDNIQLQQRLNSIPVYVPPPVMVP